MNLRELLLVLFTMRSLLKPRPLPGGVSLGVGAFTGVCHGASPTLSASEMPQRPAALELSVPVNLQAAGGGWKSQL